MKERQNILKRHQAEKQRLLLQACDNTVVHDNKSERELKTWNKSSVDSKGDSLEIYAHDSKKHLVKTVDLILQFDETSPNENTEVKEAWSAFMSNEEKCDLEKCTLDVEKIFYNTKLRKEIENKRGAKQPHFFKSVFFIDIYVPNLNSCYHEDNVKSEEQESERNCKHYSEEVKNQSQGLDATLCKNFIKGAKGDDNTEDRREHIKLKKGQYIAAEIASTSLKSASLPLSEEYNPLKKHRGSFQEDDDKLQALIDAIPQLDSVNAEKSTFLNDISLSYLHSSRQEIDFDALPEAISTATRNRLTCDSLLIDEHYLETNINQLELYYQSSEMNENAEILLNMDVNANTNKIHDTLKCANLLKKMLPSMDNKFFSAPKEDKGLDLEKLWNVPQRQKKSKFKDSKNIKKHSLSKKYRKSYKHHYCENPKIGQPFDNSSCLQGKSLVSQSSIEHSHQKVHSDSGDRHVLARPFYIDLNFCKWNCRRFMNGSSESSGYKSNNHNDHGKRSGGNNHIQGHCGDGNNNQGNSGNGGDDDKDKKPNHPIAPSSKDEEAEDSGEENTEDDADEIYLPRSPNNENQEHSSLTMDQLCHFLGLISERPGGSLFEGLEHALNMCFTRLMHELHLASLDVDFVTDCQTCQVLEGLFRHLAYSEDNCEAKCNLCHQICTLIMHHSEQCMAQIQPCTFRTSTDLCFKICQAVMGDVRMLRNDPTIMRMVVEYCSNILKILPDDEVHSGLNESGGELVKSTQTSLTDFQYQDVCSTHSAAKSNTLIGHSASVAATEEPKFDTSHKSYNQRHPLDIIDERSELSDGEHGDMTNFHFDVLQNDQNCNQISSVGFFQISQASKDAEAMMRKIPPGYAFSMPEGTINDGTQFHSFADQPTGIKGIGEVVFADSDRLCLVAKYWQKKKEECEETNKKPSQLREEGVILERYKSKFNILLTRYQQDNQWKQLTNLGYGMHGRCFLAMDMETEHQFCVKRVDLLHYEANELCLWADLDSPYIVHLYGAIRHGYHIYIFAEFIDGGDLAYVIREEKARGQRLSHWTAMSYFQQLLKALAYLHSHNILHEDIKAENILLHGNSPHIALTDFGISRRLQGQTEMKNKWPAGTATHFSPEKAASMGHGFPADMWAAICVLVYMMSGKLPWQKYLKGADCLNFIIFMRPPPMDDLPINIQDVVRDLIAKGFVKEPEKRPSAMELLQHPAFQILNGETPDSFYSTLMTGLNSVGGAGHVLVGSDIGKALDKWTCIAQSAQKNEDPEPLKSACPDTILYSLSIPQEVSGLHLADDVEDVSHLEKTEIQSVMTQINAQFENYSMKENLSDGYKNHFPIYQGAETNLSVRYVDDIIQKQEMHDLCVISDSDKGLSSAKLSPSLLPKLDELLPSSPNPVKDFFKDSYDSMQIFNERRHYSQLEIFEPLSIQTPDLIPHLSIFDGSIDMSDNENMVLPNFDLISSRSLQGQEIYAEDIMGLLVDNPSSIDEPVVSNENFSSGSPEVKKDNSNFSLSFESNLKLNVREESTIIRPSAGLNNPTKVTVLQNSTDLRKSSDVSLMRKKPQNLTLDVSRTFQNRESLTHSHGKRETTYSSDSTSIGPHSSPNGPTFANSTDIFAQQDREYKEIMSSQSSENGKFSGMFALDPDSDTGETNVPHDMETTRVTDETPPGGSVYF